MRVALLSEYQNIGGGESNLLNLCEELKKKVEVVLFCDGHLYHRAVERGIQCRKIDLSGKRWIKFLPLLTYPKGLLQELSQFDVIHAYSVNVLPRTVWVKRPVVWTTHGYWEKPFGLRARVIDLIVDKVVAVSTDVYNIADFGVHKKIQIFLGTNATTYEAPQKNFNAEKITISCIGRFQQIKGQDLLLKALRDVAIKLPNTQLTLHLIGDVNSSLKEDVAFKESLLAKASDLHLGNLSVQFEGFKENIVAFLSASDFVVIPSRYESFSMVAVEALACGKPVIAPNIGGPKDIINRSEIGTLFEPGSVDSLKIAIIEMIANFKHFDSAQCKKRAADFSVASQAERHLMVYKDICNG